MPERTASDQPKGFPKGLDPFRNQRGIQPEAGGGGNDGPSQNPQGIRPGADLTMAWNSLSRSQSRGLPDSRLLATRQNRKDGTRSSSEQGRDFPAWEPGRREEPTSLVYAEKKSENDQKAKTDNKIFEAEEIQRLETKLRQQEFQSEQDRQLVEDLTRKLDAQSRIVEKLREKQNTYEEVRTLDRKSLSRKAINQLKTELRMERLRSGIE